MEKEKNTTGFYKTMLVNARAVRLCEKLADRRMRGLRRPAVETNGWQINAIGVKGKLGLVGSLISDRRFLGQAITAANLRMSNWCELNDRLFESSSPTSAQSRPQTYGALISASEYCLIVESGVKIAVLGLQRRQLGSRAVAPGRVAK